MASLFFFFLLFRFCISTSTLNPNQTIGDDQTLVSSGEIFALGFFRPGNSKNRYLGIWYNQIPGKTVVWVANRENPISNSSGILSITGGNLKLIDGRDHTLLWSTNVSTVANYSSTATLMDSGNLVLKDDRENIIWESFDHPTHMFLPGMKTGLNRRTGLNRALTSWKSAEDPARGEFWYGLDVGGMPQLFLRKGSDRLFRVGPWNGERFSGMISMSSSTWSFHYVDNDDEIYITYRPYDTTILTRLVLEESGVLQRLTWSEKSHQWNLVYRTPIDRCNEYARCGPYGSCDPTQLPDSECKCLQGFKPRSARDWLVGDWTDGCMRREPLDCGKGDGFLRLTHVNLPDTSRSVVEPRLSLQECKDFCSKNCSCTAFASANISGEGSGCVMWGGDLIDLKVYSDVGQEIYTRVAAPELDEKPYKHSRGFLGIKKLVITISIVASLMLAFIACGYCWWKKAKDWKVNKRCDIGFNQNDFEDIGKSSKLSLFHLNVIAASTYNFSEANMLGRGGFGAVYKGKLLNGQEIAVKRLSLNSGQGIKEFKNEVLLIAKLQHKNLVRLLGCCIEREEKMLVYEYMQNKSLDSFIFDKKRRAMLDWRKRFNIIMGIARGVLYLHEDSRLRIIHRDLKASNVLLDEEMNPKISDFGLARIFGGNDTQAKTHRVVGTYGYMSPEYAMNGLFSIKSDVFSFGIILLEIISGKRNSCCGDRHFVTLIAYAWELWKEGKALELVDSLISDSCCQMEISRCIEVGLLCVQESAKDRPKISSIVFMLSNEVKVPSPKKPAFFLQKEESYSHACCSKNDVTITEDWYCGLLDNCDILQAEQKAIGSVQPRPWKWIWNLQLPQKIPRFL